MYTNYVSPELADYIADYIREEYDNPYVLGGITGETILRAVEAFEGLSR